MTVRSHHPLNGVPFPVPLGDLDEGGREEGAAREAGDAPARLLLEAMPHKVWLLGPDGAVTFANRSARTAYSDLSETRGEAGCLHPEDRARAVEARRGALASGAAYVFTGRYRSEDGNWRWHQTDTVPIPGGGGVAGWLVTAVDVDDVVADNKALEATTNLLLLAKKSAGAGLWDWNMRSGALSLSEQGAHLHGLEARACTLTSAAWTALIEPEDRKVLWDAVTQAVSTRTPFSADLRVRDGAGGVRWIQSIGRVLDDATGTSARIVGLALDITARKQSEQALARARDDAERASRAKSEFLDTMSHEIRTPLNAVLGFTDHLLKRPLDGETLRQIGVVHDAGSALLRVVDDVLDIAQIEAGRVAFDVEPFGLQDLVDGTVAIARGVASRKRLPIAVLRGPDLPARVVGDPGRIRQVLLNLLDNAVKFTAAGSATLAVTLDGLEAGQARLRFTVSDTGIGISRAQLEQLFVRFGQADGSIRRRFGGSGLGLTICRHLIDLMGGTIGIDSEPGRGTRVWVSLPLPVAEGTPA
ncbi:PAS domain-containing sensor histidine kinase [Methylobacterium crusticola]|nr:PAS domain-containing protein [Methylobacterium crusticola]